MNKLKKQCKTICSGAVTGVTVGVFLALLNSLSQIDINSWTLTGIVLGFGFAGALLPIFAPCVLKAFKEFVGSLGISSIDIILPGIGKTTLDLANPQREAARRIFLEMTTRTVTQPLDQEDGTLTAAMNSLYKFFLTVRKELKDMPPTPPGTDEDSVTLELIAHQMMNDALRPYTSRWHPRLDAWNTSGLPETDWPLYDQCRHDLDRMRSLAIKYANALGKAAEIPSVEELVPADPYPDLTNADIDPAQQDEFTKIDNLLKEIPSVQHRQVAWKLAVEFYKISATIKTNSSGSVPLRDVLQSLDKLAETVAVNISAVLPTPGDSDLDEAGVETLQDIENYRLQLPGKPVLDIQKWLKQRADKFGEIARKVTSASYSGHRQP